MDDILLRRENLDKIIANPFLAIKSRYAIIDFFAEEIDFFEEILRSVKEKENISHIKIIENFILRINDKVTKDNIAFDYSNGHFLVCNKKINARNYHSFFEQIHNLVN